MDDIDIYTAELNIKSYREFKKILETIKEKLTPKYSKSDSLNILNLSRLHYELSFSLTIIPDIYFLHKEYIEFMTNFPLTIKGSIRLEKKRIKEIKKEVKKIKKENPNQNNENSPKGSEIYNKLYDLQFEKDTREYILDYLQLQIDSVRSWALKEDIKSKEAYKKHTDNLFPKDNKKHNYFPFIVKETFDAFKNYTENHIVDPYLDYSFIFHKLLNNEPPFIHHMTHSKFMEWLKDKEYIDEKTFDMFLKKESFSNKANKKEREHNFKNVFSKLL